MRRAAQVYIVENDTYLAHHAAHRPPPCVDLWELFAGQARMTELAQEYELNALQPMDLRFGQDFKDASTRDYIMHKIKKFKPWLIPMGVDCRLWNQFSINLNWSSPERQEQLQVLQQQERLLVHFATDVAKEQYMNGRFFLIENPLRSRLWQEPALQELLALPGVWSTTLDAGAYGAEVDGQPICKPMRWVGNAPGMDLALHRRLDHLEKQYCTPVQGTLTRRSQEYPDNLCRQILQELRAIAFQKEPTRFGRPLHHVLAVSYPTTDLDAWNDVANYISGAYERSNKRPFEIPLDTEMGRNIQQLFRVKAIKIQACFAPTCRRIPSNVDEYFTRAAFLQYMDKTRAVEVEDLDEIQFPRQRFDKPVEIAVFAYGFRMMAPEHREQAPASSDKPAIVPGLMTDVSFDTKEALDSTIKRSAFDENYNPKLRAELVRCEAWVRLGASTTLVTAEQLRTAHGFEDWTPDQEDIKALKNAADSFTQHMLEDERGELKAKCRIVCLGHLDPDLELLDRSAPTPGRTTEMLMLAMITAGANGELFETQLKWHAWTADAATAFLQGQQPSERPMELYMYPPKDGLIEMTPCWSHPLYQVMGNVYGLANAPALWCSEVVARLKQLNYTRHSFDPMLFIKREGQQIVSMILVYVDDFIGVYRSGYPIEEVKNAFAWGSFHDLSKQVVTFKGKELHLHQLANKRWKLKITMSKFLNGLTPAKLPKGRTSSPPELTPTEQREFRSVSGCLQWASTQCRPEIGAAVSLSNQGNETTCHNLKDLYEAMSFLKNTPHEGLLMQDIPVNTKTVIASAADEASDRAAYVNMTLSEILFDGPAHRLGCRVDYVQTTDAKSLYDAICSEAPNLTDKRSLCNVRAIQETVDKSRMHWLPSNCQFADGLTKVSELLRTTFRKWLNAPFSILLDHPANEGLLSGIASCTKEKKTSENLKPPDCHVGTTDSFHAQS
ncbi:unnamed protein product [Durusdinium trenchii]|uniref:Reverse transcriptase Ty1/copia-type domain-containing protein n=1 Tax=Durusdinium trenchii TaxID=1381693 RepID=A0ABP0PNC3_9DINO